MLVLYDSKWAMPLFYNAAKTALGRLWVRIPTGSKSKDYKIGICCFSAKHMSLRRMSKDWLVRNQDNVSSGTTCLSADCYFSELAL